MNQRIVHDKASEIAHSLIAWAWNQKIFSGRYESQNTHLNCMTTATRQNDVISSKIAMNM